MPGAGGAADVPGLPGPWARLSENARSAARAEQPKDVVDLVEEALPTDSGSLTHVIPDFTGETKEVIARSKYDNRFHKGMAFEVIHVTSAVARAFKQARPIRKGTWKFVQFVKPGPQPPLEEYTSVMDIHPDSAQLLARLPPPFTYLEEAQESVGSGTLVLANGELGKEYSVAVVQNRLPITRKGITKLEVRFLNPIDGQKNVQRTVDLKKVTVMDKNSPFRLKGILSVQKQVWPGTSMDACPDQQTLPNAPQIAPQVQSAPPAPPTPTPGPSTSAAPGPAASNPAPPPAKKRGRPAKTKQSSQMGGMAPVTATPASAPTPGGHASQPDAANAADPPVGKSSDRSDSVLESEDEEPSAKAARTSYAKEAPSSDATTSPVLRTESDDDDDENPLEDLEAAAEL